MSDQSALNFENSFLARARYPKGKKRLQAILDAIYDIVITEGLAAASQEAIARRANVTQSAVRLRRRPHRLRLRQPRRRDRSARVPDGCARCLWRLPSWHRHAQRTDVIG